MSDVLSSPMTTVAHIDDLPVGSLRMVRVDGRRLCLVRTSEGVHAIDNACPHEGYGLTQGSLSGDVLTCAWHNWKFRVDDGACLKGEEDVVVHRVEVADDGSVMVGLHAPDPAVLRERLFASLRRGIERDYVGQISRDVVRLLQASANPGELVWEAIAYGAPRAEFGWGHSVAAATDCLAMVDLHEGDERALPIVQAIAGISEPQRGRPPRPLPPPAEVPVDGATAFRALVEQERLVEAQALVLGAIESGHTADDLRRWFTGVVSDHHLSYGHAAIYSQKAFQLLELLGWERAPTVLPHLVPTIVHGTREDLLPYMRPFLKGLGDVDVERLSEITPDPGWRDGGRLRDALLGPDRRSPATAVVEALRDGAGVEGVLDTVVAVTSERLLRYDVATEFVLEDDFGWLDITHGLTYANAVRWLHRHGAGPDTTRLALFCAFQAHWTGRHEWHTAVGPSCVGAGTASADLVAACADRRPDDAVATALQLPVEEAAAQLQRAAMLDRSTAAIVHAHGVKTSRAAAEEARLAGSSLPLAATARFLAGPKLERFVAASVTRSIDLLAGRAPGRQEE